MRRFKRPRDRIYGIGGLVLFVFAAASGFDGGKLALFILWACGGALVLDGLDRRRDRDSNAR